MSDFKVGDKVRLKENTYQNLTGGEAFQPGVIGTITRLAEGSTSAGADIDVAGQCLYFFGSEYEAIEPEYDQDTVNAIVRSLRDMGWYGSATKVEDEFGVPKTRTVTAEFQVPEGKSLADYLGDIEFDYDITGGN